MGVSGGAGTAVQHIAAKAGTQEGSEKMLREVPVAYLVFDVLYAGGELLIDRPLRERARVLDELLKDNTHHGHTETRRNTRAGPGSQEKLTFGEIEAVRLGKNHPRTGV